MSRATGALVALLHAHYTVLSCGVRSLVILQECDGNAAVMPSKATRVLEQVGVLKARAVASACGIPMVPVHHMEAHALVARLTGSGDDPGVQGSMLTSLIPPQLHRCEGRPDLKHLCTTSGVLQ